MRGSVLILTIGTLRRGDGVSCESSKRHYFVLNNFHSVAYSRSQTAMAAGLSVFPDGNSALVLVCACSATSPRANGRPAANLDMSWFDEKLRGESELIIAPWTVMIQSAHFFRTLPVGKKSEKRSLSYFSTYITND